MAIVGIPKSIFYYYYGDLWKNYFDYLQIPYVVSPNTNKKIMADGLKLANDEMCLSMKIYLGHVNYLKDKCDFILVPRIDNFGINDQTCTNFLSAYDIVNNLFDMQVLNYNIDLRHGENLKQGLVKIGLVLNRSKKECIEAYKYAYKKHMENRRREVMINQNKLNSDKLKILLVSHPYNTYDDFVGRDVIKYLTQNDVQVIYSDKFDEKVTSDLSKQISKDLYFKYPKENVGAIIYAQDKIDGVIFLSVFPCGPDSLVTEMAMRKIKLPYINLVLDDASSFTGIETRLESFIDMLGGFNDD